MLSNIPAQPASPSSLPSTQKLCESHAGQRYRRSKAGTAQPVQQGRQLPGRRPSQRARGQGTTVTITAARAIGGGR